MARAWGGMLAGAAALLMLAGGAVAEDLALEAFHGTFQGSGIARSDVSDYFGLTVRDLDVTMAPAGAGFSITWTTVLRQSGNPDNPDIRHKSATLEFAPSTRPGLYRARSNGDAVAGAPLAWAYVRGHTLTIHLLAVSDSGDYEMQTYHRTLTGLGMELEFINVGNGETIRRVEGRLTKRAN